MTQLDGYDSCSDSVKETTQIEMIIFGQIDVILKSLSSDTSSWNMFCCPVVDSGRQNESGQLPPPLGNLFIGQMTDDV